MKELLFGFGLFGGRCLLGGLGLVGCGNFLDAAAHTGAAGLGSFFAVGSLNNHISVTDQKVTDQLPHSLFIIYN